MANQASYVSYSHAPGGFVDFELRFTVALTGSYVTAATGETVDLTKALNPNGLELNGFLPVGGGDIGYPTILIASFLGYQAVFTVLTAGTFTVRFYVLTTGAELASGAFPAAITGGALAIAVRHRG